MRKLRDRLAGAFLAASMFFSAVAAPAAVIGALFAPYGVAADTELCQKSLEVYPNGDYTVETVKLEGMMPANATAEAVDVTEEYDGVAAYDITITSGTKEYQPGEAHPIYVEIIDPEIPDSNALTLWHIADDGTREQITDFHLSDGKISFFATGFSVYQIVNPPFSGGLFKQIAAKGADGFDVSYVASQKKNANGTPDRGGPFYITDIIENATNGRTGIRTNKQGDETGRVKLYFEPAGKNADDFYIYFQDAGGTKRYLEMYTQEGGFGTDSYKLNRAAIRVASSAANKTVFRLDKHPNSDKIRIHATLNDEDFLWIRDGKTHVNKTTQIVGYKNTSNDEGDAGSVWMTLDGIYTDSLGLAENTYGMMYFPTGSTMGYALMADSEDGNVHSLEEVVLRKPNAENGVTVFVDKGSEVTAWTFHAAEGGKYTVTAEVGGETKYLAASGNALTLADDAAGAAPFNITISGNAVTLETDGKYVHFVPADQTAGTAAGYILSDAAADATPLNMVDFAEIPEDNLINYSADRISVADAQNGEKVIVYTRVWNDTTKQYDIYAVDYNGKLYPCYATGGKIMWIGDGTCSLEWEFTEYLHEVTKQPNGYYELYNPYSEKYIAPQMQQVLSDGKLGINMAGRKAGDFYSTIMAWDKTHYRDVGLRVNTDTMMLEPCSEANAADFYFARLENLNLNDKLHEVPTVDNFEHGITIKMQDFSSRNQMSNFLGTNVGGAVLHTQSGIFSTKLGDDEYPVIAKGDHKGQSLAGLYNAPVTVNHLFLESEYNSSGYFEFDSCQNFATLCNEDGTLKTPVNYTDYQGNAVPTIDFTVYKELGTSDNLTDPKTSCTRKHGQFFPYDTIAGKPISVHKNTYSSLTNAAGDFGELSDDDPRKGEQMFNVGNNSNSNSQPNYYNGMELEASFVQTVSGLDAWGHDIVFEFTGDDDFWLFVDGELIIDLGGIHSALEGNVNFSTGRVYVNFSDKVSEEEKTKTLKQVFIENFTARYKADHSGAEPSYEEISEYLLKYFQPDASKPYGCEEIFADYSTHKMRIFYMERGAGASNLHMRFNIASVTPGQVVVSKTLAGGDAAQLDPEFMEYPFQIFYQLDEDGDGVPEAEQPLKNTDAHISVVYHGTEQAAKYVQKYRPPGCTDAEAYENVYFINPTKDAEIRFPEKTIKYRLVECAVDDTIYDGVLINGQEPEPGNIQQKGQLWSYSSDLVSAEERPSIAFENKVKSDVVKDLKFTKLLQDKNGTDITDDPATFSFRLYTSSVDVPADEIPPVDRGKYYVLNSAGEVCFFDYDTQTFVSTGLEYTHPAMAALVAYTNTDTDPRDEDHAVWEEYNSANERAIGSYGIKSWEDVTFRTSQFGAISNIPAGYTVCVPSMPVNAIFKVTEDVKAGYGLKEYRPVMGLIVDAEGQSHEFSSYDLLEGHPTDQNIGRIVANGSAAQMEVINRRGYGLTVNKAWSDLSLTTYHDPVYVAVYADGTLLEDTVKQIASPATSAYYFWETLAPNADNTPRRSLDGYEVREVTISAESPTVAEDGTVTNYGTVTPKAAGSITQINATLENETAAQPFDYAVSYQKGTDEGSVRTDTVSNTRTGGIAIRLFKWQSENPLEGGVFKLTDNTGAVVGTYTSDKDGTVTILYDCAKNVPYTLQQTAAPAGYVGLQKKLKFVVANDGSVTLYQNDGTSPWDDPDDPKWANSKPGSNGITAFVDVYNKPFNFKVMKIDSSNSAKKLSAAHFALYKQMNTPVSGYVKNKEPMTGFEDMSTVNGEVVICGEGSDRVITPGESGAVYFLTEIAAPAGYTRLTEDILFSISPTGLPTIISTGYENNLTETDDSYIFTLDVPNVKTNETVKLTVRKQVSGSLASKAKSYDFTLDVEGVDDSREFPWSKNGTAQTEPLHTGGHFTLSHDDTVEITLPVNATVTLTEDNAGCQTVFKKGTETLKTGSSVTVFVQENMTLDVLNTIDGVIPTGIAGNLPAAVLLFFGALSGAAYVLLRRKHAEREDAPSDT